MNDEIRKAAEEIREAGRRITDEVNAAVREVTDEADEAGGFDGRSGRRHRRDRHSTPGSQRRQAWWGVLVIAIGVYFMLRNFSTFDIPSLGDLWPLIIIVFGVMQLLTQRKPSDIEGGVFFTLLGLWFLAVEMGWWGLRWSTGWPLILVIWGVGAILRAFLERASRSQAGGGA